MGEILPDDLILVAILKEPRDLEIARVLGWYRIPLGSAPKTVRVDWVAFYLPSAFGELKWSIRFIAPVKGYELVTRIELLREDVNHPNKDAPYFKLQLGPLMELQEPIIAKRWRRFTFLYTTGERMHTAREIKDLRVPPSHTRDRLWKILRERGDTPGSPSRVDAEQAGINATK